MKISIKGVLIALLGFHLSNAYEHDHHGYADFVFDDVPSHMEVGQQVLVSWYTPRDYKIEELSLYKLEDHARHKEGRVPHLWATPKGNSSMIWTVPNVRRGSGPYRIYVQARELLQGDNGHLVQNSSIWRTVANTNSFEIEGGVKLLGKEIAGIVVGSVAGAVLLAVLFVFGMRFWRKRQSVAVDLPGPGEGGYSDVREVSE